MNHGAHPALAGADVSASFFDGLRRGLLVLQRCESCQTHQLGRRSCFACGAAKLVDSVASGRALLHGLAVVHTVYQASFAARVPYEIALVELEEGPQIHASIVDHGHAELRIGMPLVVMLRRLEDGSIVPCFRPEAEHTPNEEVTTSGPPP